MLEIRKSKDLPLVRFIAPAFPAVNVFTRSAGKLTPLGLIMVATAANKVQGLRVEVIDENNWNGPRDKRGLPDHEALQRESPATVVGMYCGLSSTMGRVFELAEFYKKRKAVILAGGWHVHYCPEEALANGIDVVVHGDGEIVIQEILDALLRGEDFDRIPGIHFLEAGKQRTNPPEISATSCLSELPYPDFGLLKYARSIRVYPIGRIRGCGRNCEFCSVKGEPRWANAEHLFNVVNWLVATRGARSFFIVDDRLEEDLAGTIEFFRMIFRKYRNRLTFTVQIRLETAENTELQEAMSAAGVKFVCTGYESPIDEDLKTMRKGFLSSRMLLWTKILRRRFWVHGMFIFGYPAKDGSSGISAEETVRRFRRFIARAHLDSIQVMHAIPLVGTALRTRLEAQGRVFPLELVPWSRYDGNWACFVPDPNMTLQQFQEYPMDIMRWFYGPLSLFRIGLRILAFPVDCAIRGWGRWHRGWIRDIIKYGAHLLVRRWRRSQDVASFVADLERHRRKAEQET